MAGRKGGVLFSVGLIVTLAFVVGTLVEKWRAVKICRKTEGVVMATSLAMAVETFYGEYVRLPDVGGMWVETTSPDGVKILEVLLGLEGAVAAPQNPRSIIFLQVNEAKGKKGGIEFSPTDKVLGIYDPSGRPYQVVLNAGKNDSLEFKFGSQQVKLRGKQVAVFSFGPDGQPNTPDDIKSWN